jgi:hypothetical protein
LTFIDKRLNKPNDNGFDGVYFAATGNVEVNVVVENTLWCGGFRFFTLRYSQYFHFDEGSKMACSRAVVENLTILQRNE